MNLQHLKYFLAVARSGSFSRAAEEMRVTQPTVSSGVNDLERSLGVTLFNRNSRHVALTMEGRALVSYGMEIEDLVESTEERLRRRDVLPGEGFQFGAIDAAVTYLLPELLKDYMARYPEVAISVQVGPTGVLVEDLLMNRSEFAVITLPFSHARIETVSIYRDTMHLVAGADHELVNKRTVAMQQVAREPLILFHQDSVSRKIVDEQFAEAGVAPGVVMEMRSPEAMRKLVEVGVGLSFLPGLTVQESLASGSLKEIRVKGVAFRREIGVAWRRGRYFSPAIRHLLDEVFREFDVVQEAAEKLSGRDSDASKRRTV